MNKKQKGNVTEAKDLLTKFNPMIKEIGDDISSRVDFYDINPINPIDMYIPEIDVLAPTINNISFAQDIETNEEVIDNTHNLESIDNVINNEDNKWLFENNINKSTPVEPPIKIPVAEPVAEPVAVEAPNDRNKFRNPIEPINRINDINNNISSTHRLSSRGGYHDD